MKEKVIFGISFFIMSFIANSIMGQDSLKLKLIDYLIKVGDLDTAGDKQKYLNNIYVVELIKFSEVKDTGFGIFKFGANADHVKTYLLVKDNKDFQILTLEQIDQDLLKELTFLKQKGYNPDIIIQYIEATIKVYQKNLKAIPWTE